MNEVYQEYDMELIANQYECRTAANMLQAVLNEIQRLGITIRVSDPPLEPGNRQVISLIKGKLQARAIYAVHIEEK